MLLAGLVFRLEQELDEPLPPGEDATDGVLPFTMPALNAWDRRYYRQSFTQGQEVALLRRILGARWLVLKPDLTIAALQLSARTTVLTTPAEGVQWLPMPILTDGQKADFVRRAGDMVQNQQCAGLDLPLYRAGRQVRQAFVAQAGLALLTWPGRAARSIRWGLRSRTRFLGLLAALALLYVVLDGAGILSGITAGWDIVRDGYFFLRAWISETNEFAIEWIAWWEDWVFFLRAQGSLRRWLLVVICVTVLAAVWVMEGDEDRGSSSAGSSPPPSELSDSGLGAAGSTAATLPGAEVQALRVSLERQSQLINDLLESQRSMQQELADARTAARKAEILAQSDLQPRAGPHTEERDMAFLDKMNDRLAKFEGMLREHAGVGSRDRSSSTDAAASHTAVPAPAPDASASHPAAPAPAPDAKGEGHQGIQRALKKMHLKSRRIGEAFAKQMEEYREVDAEEWGAHFPPGYRERLAGEFIAEIVANDKTLESWSRDFLRDRELLDCHPARELVAVCSAMDSMIMSDTESGLLNKVGFERLARKAYGIVQAFRKVETRSDWLKPKSAANNWKSKVDWNAARQYDPALRTTGVPTVTGAEEEVRKEQEREAALLKARAKLAEHSSGGEAFLSPS